jgi:hypothetical protein
MVVAGIFLAVVASALLGAVLVHELAERRGKRNVAVEPGLKPASEDAASDRPVPLQPGSGVTPASSAPTEPIAPLEVVPTTKKGRN